jgi:FkbM family methyltransferase
MPTISATLTATAKRVVYHLPAPWRQALRKRYIVYTLRSEPPPPELPLLARLVTPGSLVIDAGANVGTYTVALAKAVPSARILSIEPIPTTRELLTHSVRALGLSNVTVVPVALSDRAARVVMEIPELGGQPMLTLARIKYSDASKPPLNTHVEVETSTLDRLLASERAPVSLLKCDVEMHELELLRGAIGIIRRDHPAIYAELQPDFKTKASQRAAVFALLAAEGYAPYWFDGGTVRAGSEALDVLFLTVAHRQGLGLAEWPVSRE